MPAGPDRTGSGNRELESVVTAGCGAAQILGVKPSTLQFRIDKLGMRADLERARVASHRARSRARQN